MIPNLFGDPVRPADLRSYDWIVVSSSAGKDSLCTLDTVYTEAEAAGVLSRVVVVHADLGRVEWPGTPELAERQAQHYGVRFHRVWRRQGDLLQQIEKRGKFPGPATRFCTAHHKQNQVARVFTELSNEMPAPRDGDLLHQVEERGMWPDPKRRYCTSDQKRAQVHRLFTHLASEAGAPRQVRILSCMGMRADESPARAKKLPFIEREKAASNGRRQVDLWLPIHHWAERRVWQHIQERGLSDLMHPAYALGMPRLSCCFCIFASRDALTIAGKHNPELLAEYVRVEEQIGHRFRVDLSLAEVQRRVKAGDVPERAEGWVM